MIVPPSGDTSGQALLYLAHQESDPAAPFDGLSRPLMGKINIAALPENACFVLEKVDMLSSLGVMQTAPKEEAACPRAYCTTASASLAIATFARSSTRER